MNNNLITIKPKWPAPAHIKACTTLKNSWGLMDPGKNNQDQYAELIPLLDLPNHPCWLKQVHGTTVLEATASNSGKEGDVCISNAIREICLVTTADCLPVLLCDKKGSQVAAIHAGWRGLASNILEKTVHYFHSQDLLAWLGPAIGPTKFVVGKDVYTHFLHQKENRRKAFVPFNQEKWLANLYLIASQQLLELGIKNIYGGEYCTYTQSELFYSYRRDQGLKGKMASLIWIDKK